MLMPRGLKRDIQAVFGELHRDPACREYLGMGFIERFAAVSDGDYDDIREMLAFCERAGFLELK